MTAGIPSALRNARSPRKIPKNRAPSPTSSAASGITDIEVSTVQYGAGQASVPGPGPLARLSASE